MPRLSGPQRTLRPTMTGPSPAPSWGNIPPHQGGGVVYGRSTAVPYSLDVWIPPGPNSELIYNSFAFPICKLQRKSRRPKGEILAENILPLQWLLIENYSFPERGADPENPARIPVPGTGRGPKPKIKQQVSMAVRRQPLAPTWKSVISVEVYSFYYPGLP